MTPLEKPSQPAQHYGPDHISFDLGNPGGIITSFLAKVPGPQMRLGQARMEFSYEGPSAPKASSRTSA